MLYFAYGSNLHHFQMKRRCKDSTFIKKINLKDFRLTFRSKYRAADIEPKKNSIVPGGLFEISKSDEKKLDVYEDYPILYKKYYFLYKIGQSSYTSNFFSSIFDISNNPPGSIEFFFGSISAALYLLLKVNLKSCNFIFFKNLLSLHLLFI